MFSTFSSAPAAAPPTPAPAADAPSKTEQTPLVAGKSETSEEKPWMTALAMVVMIGIAVGKTQLTAFLFSYADFPTAYSGWSCVVTCILIGCVFPFKPSMWACPTRQMWPMLLIIVLFTSLDLAGTNIALANLSTSFQQCIAATNPFITIIIETLLYCKLQHWLTYSVVAVVVVGTVLTSLGQVEIDLVGLIFELLAVCSSAAKYAFTHKAFRDFKGQLGALALLFWIDLLMIPVFTVWTLSTGELQLFFADVLHSSTDWWQMTGTAALGGVRALSQFVVLMFVSATSMSTANVFTQILNILISMIFTQSDKTVVSPPLIVGVALVMVFSLLYAIIKSNKSVLKKVDEACPCCATAEEKPKAQGEEKLLQAA